MCEGKISNQRQQTAKVNLSSPPEKKRVSFAHIEIRRYPITLGEHPECSCGPPITLDWDYQVLAPVEVDRYETTRDQPRKTHQLFVPTEKRRNMLIWHCGCTEEDLEEAEREVMRIRRLRKKSDKFVLSAKVGGIRRAVGRKVSKLADVPSHFVFRVSPC